MQMWLHQAEWEDHVPGPAGQTSPKILLAFLATRVHCWLIVSLSSTSLCLNGLDVEAKSTPSKFAADTKLGVADTPDNYAATQRSHDRLEKWANRNFNKENCKVRHLGRKNPIHHSMLGFLTWKPAWQKRT